MQKMQVKVLETWTLETSKGPGTIQSGEEKSWREDMAVMFKWLPEGLEPVMSQACRSL